MPVRAADMVFPLVCTPGRTCFIVQYPDDDDSDAARDYACGPSASDGDGALRIALGDLSMVTDKVPVLAAKAGIVDDVSDGLADRVVASRADLKTGTSLCGNGVVLGHGLGQQTAYCHLLKGSITVKKGDRVQQGQIIGAVGQSGLATWPQLAFSIMSGGLFIDPITGNTVKEGCGFKPRPMIALPQEFMEYQPAAIVAMGFATKEISAGDMELGRAPRFGMIDKSERTINLWAMVLGVKKGDRIEMRLRDPRGRTFEYQDVIAANDQDRLPLNVTRSRGYSDWRIGRYLGEITITRQVQNRPASVTRNVSMLME